MLGSARTGSDGNAFSDSAGVAMVTAAIVHGYNRRLVTWTNVEPGDRLQLSDTLPSDPVGSYAVTPTGIPKGDTVRAARIGRCEGARFNGEPDEKPIEIRLRPDCLGTTPLTILVSGSDSKGLGTQAFHTNAALPATPGGNAAETVPVRWAPPRTAPGYVSFVGFPPGGKLSLTQAPVMSGLLYGELQVQDVDPTQRYTFGPSVTGPHDAYQAQADERSAPTTRRGLIARTPTDANVEVAEDALLPLLSEAKVDRSNGPRPIVTWSGDTSTTTGGIVNLAYDVDGGTVSWSLVVAPGATRTLAPSLPTDLAGWAPTAKGTTAVTGAAIVLFRSELVDAPRLRASYGKLFNLWTRTDSFPLFPALPDNGTLAWTGALAN